VLKQRQISALVPAGPVDGRRQEFDLMRKYLLLGAFAFAGLLPAGASQAYYDGPWCAVTSDGAGGIVENCSMLSFEMCRTEALSFGPTGFCRQNGRYPGYWAAPHEPRRVKHKRHHHQNQG
jgi:hypothetical protein